MEDRISKREMSDLELVQQSMKRAQTGALAPPEMLMESSESPENKEQELEKACTKQKIDAFEKGYQHLYEQISEKSFEGIYSKIEAVEPIPLEKFQIKPEIMDSLRKSIAKHDSDSSLYKKCNYSNDILLVLYEFGTKFYEESLYEKSIHSFTFLTTIHPTIEAFWVSLGLSYEKNLNYPEALKAYEKAIEVDPTIFTPFFGLIRCGEELKDFSKAIEVLENHKNNESTKENVELGLAYIKDKKLNF